MLVGERMTKRPLITHPDTPIDDALKLMRDSKVRRLPVLDKDGKLVGIVTEKDLLYVSPSPATSLSVHELHYLISKIKVEDVMAKDVVTATEYTPLEEAARIMADNKIGSLPVMRDGKLVGIVTETNLFCIFLELLGAREKGARLTTMSASQATTTTSNPGSEPNRRRMALDSLFKSTSMRGLAAIIQ